MITPTPRMKGRMGTSAVTESGQVLKQSTSQVANVNTQKEKGRQEQGNKPPRDDDIHWGVKGTRRFQDASGQKVKQKEYFFGYKAHCSANAESGLITSIVVTPDNANNGQVFPELLEKDLAKDIPVDIVTADQAYDDGDNHFLLESKGNHSAIRPHGYRTGKKDPKEQIWLDLQASPQYQAGLSERYKIERKFGEAKQEHGLGRCRYVGLLRYGLQAFLTAIVLNLKRIVKLLTGTQFKGRARLAA